MLKTIFVGQESVLKSHFSDKNEFSQKSEISYFYLQHSDHLPQFFMLFLRIELLLINLSFPC